MKSAALALASRGMSVFPLKPRSKLPTTGSHGCSDATKDLEVVGVIWEGGPELNIGIATGSKSGIFVLDIDPDKGGETSLAELEARFAPLPATVESITGSGGRHLLFKLPVFDGAPEIRNSAGKLGPGLDIRGEGGYIVAPPSIHPNGKAYAWSVDSASAFAEAPIWLLSEIDFNPVVELDARRPDSYWARLINEGVDEGSRNDAMSRIVGGLLRAGIDREISDADFLHLVLAINTTRFRPPLSKREVCNIVGNIYDREQARRVAK